MMLGGASGDTRSSWATKWEGNASSHPLLSFTMANGSLGCSAFTWAFNNLFYGANGHKCTGSSNPGRVLYIELEVGLIGDVYKFSKQAETDKETG